MKSGIRHVGIVVQDIQKSINFWRDHFDFSIFLDQIEEGPFIEHLLNIPKVKIRTVKMKGQDNSLIELLYFFEKQDIDQWRGNLNSTGLTHLALNINNLNEKIEKLQFQGFKLINQPRKSENGSVLVAFIKGPEGILIELVESVEHID
jgi:catechol 2,3-dioxygenase-like lactoylglutathione lyase family enzyme